MTVSGNLEVALTRCYYCGDGNEVILNTLLTKKCAEAVKAMHHKVVSTEPCPTCQKWMKDGIILITIDEVKSGKGWEKDKIPNPHRTGGFFVVKEGFVEKVFAAPKAVAFAKKHRWLFISHEAAEQVGLFASAAVKKD